MAFVHDLVRVTLYGRLDEAAARRRHAAMVKAGVQRVPEIAALMPPASLAHHAYHAVPDVAPATAVALQQAAGAEASGRLAFEEAVGHQRRALELVRKDDLRAYAAVAFQLALAEQVAGELVACRETLKDVAAVARTLDDPELLARAALRLRGAAWLSDPETAHHATELINEAHRGLAGGSGSPIDDLDRERDLSARLVESARAAGDDEALWDGLVAYYDAVWAPGTARLRARVADELMAVAHRAADHYSELLASMLRSMALLERGDPGWLREHEALVSLAERIDSAFSRDLGQGARCIRAAFVGRFDDARALMEEGRAAATRRFGEQQPEDWMALNFQQVWTIELLQGRDGVMDTLLGSAAAQQHPDPRLLEALAAVRWGDVDPGLRHLEKLAAVPPSRWFQPLWLVLQAEVAVASKDPQRCEDAHARLAPLAGEWLKLYGDTPLGPAVHWLAMLDAAQERWDRAVDGFAAAQQAADRLGARPYSLEAGAGLGAALLGRGGPGDASAAAVLLGDVEREALGLGMTRLAHHVRRIRAGQAGMAGPAPPEREIEVGVGVFRRDDRVWTLALAGRTVHLPDAKGLHDLHVLGRRGMDVPATELLNPGGGETARAAAQLGGGPVLDRRAVAAYRNRLKQLDEWRRVDRRGARRPRRRPRGRARPGTRGAARRAAPGNRPGRPSPPARRPRRTCPQGRVGAHPRHPPPPRPPAPRAGRPPASLDLHRCQLPIPTARRRHLVALTPVQHRGHAS